MKWLVQGDTLGLGQSRTNFQTNALLTPKPTISTELVLGEAEAQSQRTAIGAGICQGHKSICGFGKFTSAVAWSTAESWPGEKSQVPERLCTRGTKWGLQQQTQGRTTQDYFFWAGEVYSVSFSDFSSAGAERPPFLLPIKIWAVVEHRAPNLFWGDSFDNVSVSMSSEPRPSRFSSAAHTIPECVRSRNREWLPYCAHPVSLWNQGLLGRQRH